MQHFLKNTAYEWILLPGTHVKITFESGTWRADRSQKHSAPPEALGTARSFTYSMTADWHS